MLSETHDNRIVLRSDWPTVETLIAARGEKLPRVRFLDHALELTSPGFGHALTVSTIGRMIESWSFERDVELTSLGSLLLSDRSTGVMFEPDACFFIGRLGDRRIPDLVVDVAWSEPTIDSIELCARLGVRELWVWRDAVLHPWRLDHRRMTRVREPRASEDRSRVVESARLATRPERRGESVHQEVRIPVSRAIFVIVSPANFHVSG